MVLETKRHFSSIFVQVRLLIQKRNCFWNNFQLKDIEQRDLVDLDIFLFVSFHGASHTEKIAYND